MEYFDLSKKVREHLTEVEWEDQAEILEGYCETLNISLEEAKAEYQSNFTSEEMIFFTFLEWLIEKRSIQSYCKKLGKSEEELRREYETFKEETVFCRWLEQNIDVLDPELNYYCQQLGRSKGELYDDWCRAAQAGETYGYFKDWVKKEFEDSKRMTLAKHSGNE